MSEMPPGLPKHPLGTFVFVAHNGIYCASHDAGAWPTNRSDLREADVPPGWSPNPHRQDTYVSTALNAAAVVGT
jgi:hypothetical protein